MRGCLTNFLAAIIILVVCIWGMNSCFKNTSQPGPAQTETAQPSQTATPLPQKTIKDELTLGIELAAFDRELRRSFRQDGIALPSIKGMLVISVVPDSPADQVGIKAQDIILKANKSTLTDSNSFDNVLGSAKAHDVIQLEYFNYRKVKGKSTWNRKSALLEVLTGSELKQKCEAIHLAREKQAEAEKQKQREAFIREMMQKGIFKKIDSNGDLWVATEFMLLDFEAKKTAVSVVAAYLYSGQKNSDCHIVLKDNLTGNKIGIFDAFSGLKLK